MGEDQEAQELRALQAKAFGRGASASAADLARLYELRHHRLQASPSPIDPQPEPVDSTKPHPLGEPTTHEPTPTTVEPTRRRSRFPAGAVPLTIAAVLIGLVVGGVSTSLVLPQLATLSSPSELPPNTASFDDGSIEFLGIIRSGKLWTASQNDGEERCLILTDEKEQGGWMTMSCQPSSSRVPLTATASGLSDGTAREYTVSVDDDGEESVVYRTIDSPFPE
jgi:hypothetical protein